MWDWGSWTVGVFCGVFLVVALIGIIRGIERLWWREEFDDEAER